MPEIPDLGRLQALAPHLQPDRSPCPFVLDPGAANDVLLAHYSGGLDATYVIVSRFDKQPRHHDLSVTISYAPSVDGTTIIYDATAEMMQGKARPFACNLGSVNRRVYAVLPFQIEETAIRIEKKNSTLLLDVAFHDARGDVISAALPFEMQFLNARKAIVDRQFRATNQSGRFQMALNGNSIPDGVLKVLVRSLLTGADASQVFPTG